MLAFLTDEDTPRSLAPALRAAGFGAADVRDSGLRGAHDDDVIKFAVTNGYALITRDVGIASVVRYPLGSHEGILLIRVDSTVPAPDVVARVVRVVGSLEESEVRGNLVVITMQRVRVRRPTGGAP